MEINSKMTEPVAWMDKETGQVSRVACYSIPLYTTPQTKPLSDEEIEKLASSKMWDYLTYARAIEERHGIKWGSPTLKPYLL